MQKQPSASVNPVTHHGVSLLLILELVFHKYMKNIVFFFKKKKLVPEGPGTGPEGTSPPGLVYVYWE